LSSLTHFHFLRPEWLWLLLPAILLIWALWRVQRSPDGWSSVMAPHLLEQLQTSSEESSAMLRPHTLVSLMLLIAVLALSGPAWQRGASPFSEDRSAAVLVLRVSPEMLASDIQPSRLQRAMHKIHDLLELRAGTRNALIAYYGSAHLVMPLTSDAEVIESFAAGLEPGVMPQEGDAVADAIRQANELLRQAGAAGSIVLLTDAIDAAAGAELAELKGADVHILGLAAGPEVVPPVDSPPAPALDMNSLRQSARALGGTATAVTIDDADVRQLARRIERSFINAPPEEGERWRDEGWWLLLPLAALLLLLFRQGGAVVLR
jgi:Ca-activated chloride channel family protein